MMFIAIDGADGTGKTTVIPMVAQILVERGFSIAIKPEFPPGELSKTFQDALGKGLFLAEHLEMPPAAAFFYLLHSEVLAVRDALSHRADIVMADRYLYTHALYQAYFATHDQRQFDPVRLVRILSDLFKALLLPLPDLVVVLDAPLDILVQRLAIRESRNITNSEQAVLRVFQTAYDSFVSASVCPSLMVDASGSSIELARTIADAITNRIQETKI